MEQTFIHKVYTSLQGITERDVLVPGVEAAFAKGQVCQQLYKEVFEAKCRLNDLYNQGHELEDVEIIIGRMFDIMEVIGHKMYLYGATFGTPEGNTAPQSPAEGTPAL